MTFWYTLTFAAGVFVGFFLGAAALDRYYLEAYAKNLHKLVLDLQRTAADAEARAKTRHMN